MIVYIWKENNKRCLRLKWAMYFSLEEKKIEKELTIYVTLKFYLFFW